MTIDEIIPGRGLAEEEMHRPPTLTRVAETMRRYNEGPEFPGVFSPFRTVRDYLAFAAPRGAPLPDRFDWMLAQADRVESVSGLLDRRSTVVG
jgi:hypothetical protein